VSLRLRERLRTAAEEQEMDRLLRSKAGDEETLILEESLRILADLVALESKHGAARPIVRQKGIPQE